MRGASGKEENPQKQSTRILPSPKKEWKKYIYDISQPGTLARRTLFHKCKKCTELFLLCLNVIWKGLAPSIPPLQNALKEMINIYDNYLQDCLFF